MVKVRDTEKNGACDEVFCLPTLNIAATGVPFLKASDINTLFTLGGTDNPSAQSRA